MRHRLCSIAREIPQGDEEVLKTTPASFEPRFKFCLRVLHTMNPQRPHRERGFDLSGFAYCPETGEVTRNGKPVGSPQGRTCEYLRVQSGKHRVVIHRLAWRIITGDWPTCVIDHINGNRRDNRWINLRSASLCGNQQNVAVAAGVSGYRNVYFDAVNCIWCFSVQASGVRRRFYASTCFSAVCASRLIRRLLHGEFYKQAA